MGSTTIDSSTNTYTYTRKKQTTPHTTPRQSPRPVTHRFPCMGSTMTAPSALRAGAAEKLGPEALATRHIT